MSVDWMNYQEEIESSMHINMKIHKFVEDVDNDSMMIVEDMG